MPCPTAFNPADGLIRSGWETVCNMYPGASAMDKYHLFANETLTSNAEVIQRNSIISGGQTPQGLPSKIPVGGDINVEWDAEGHCIYLANLQQFVTTTNPTGSVYLHKMGPSFSTEMPGTFSTEVWRDDSMAQLFVGNRASQATFSLAQRTVLTGAISIVSTFATYYDDPAYIGGGTSTVVQRLRGYPAYSDWAATDGDVYVKITDAGSLPSAPFNVSAKVTAAASYGAAETVISAVGTDANGLPYWTSLVDSNGSGGAFIGSRDLPVQIWFPNTTSLALNDEWRFDRDRGVWTPTFPDVPPFNEIFAAIYIDGEAYCIEQVDLTVTRPVIPVWCIGGRFPDRTIRQGRSTVTGSFQRKYLDTSIRKRLERGQTFKLVIQAYSGEEITTGYEHYIKLVCPLCVPSGPTPSIASADEFNETLNFTSHPNAADAEGYVDDLNIEIQNSISDLAA